MFFNKNITLFVFILYFLLLSEGDSHTIENPKQDSYALKGTSVEESKRTKELDNEFKAFEEKLKRLKLMLNEESSSKSPQTAKGQSTANSNNTPDLSEHQRSNSMGSEQNKLWFQRNDHEWAVKDHLDQKFSDILEAFNPFNFIPDPDHLFKPINSMINISQTFIPEPFRISTDIMKTTERFSQMMTRDMPQLLQRMPETLEGMVTSLNIMRMNGTESAKNQTNNLFSKISKHLFVWTVLIAETDLMATLSLGLFYRAYVHILKVKATPLPTEILNLQTSLNTLTLHLSKTLPITIKVLNSGLHGNATNELDQLLMNINDTNKAMDTLQNQTNSFQQKIERIPTTSNVFDKEALDKFQNSLLSLIQSFNRIPENIPIITSLFLNQSEYLIKFLGYLSEIFVVNGVGWKLPESIRVLQERIQQLLNIKDLPPFLNSSSPIGKAAVHLLVTLQGLFVALHTSMVTPGVAMKPLIFAIESCIGAIQGLKSANVSIPPVITEPLLILLEMMAKFIKTGIIQNI